MTNKIGLAGSLYTVPVEPDAGEYAVEDLVVAGSERALDGTLHTAYAAVKRHWRVAWSGLTSAQRDLLLAELRRQSHLVWEPPEGSSYTVKVVSSNWTVTREANVHYTVTAELEQE